MSVKRSTFSLDDVQKKLNMVTPISNRASNPVFKANPIRPQGIQRTKVGGMVYNGREFIGTPMNIKTDDPEHMKPQKVTAKVTVKFFVSSSKTDMEEYAQIYQDHVDKKIIIGFDQQNFYQATGDYHILIQYAKQYYTNPAGVL